MNGAPIRWHVFPDAPRTLAAAREAIAAGASEALRRRGRFLIVLTGGKTPGPLYESLATLDTDWPRWELYFGDERCVPPDHPERNERLARDAWLDRVPIPAGNVHPIPAELGPALGAERYRAPLAGVGDFDLVLAGVGSDGHTASLFPGATWGDEPDAPDALPVHGSPKPPPERVTLSAARLKRTRATLLLALGPDKRAALEALRAGASIPLAATVPAAGMDVFADAAAAGDLRASDGS